MANLWDTGLGKRGRRMASAIGELAQLRFELFQLEAREERARVVRLVVESIVATFAGFAAFICLNVLMLILSNERQRVQILVGLIVFYGLLALWAALSLRRRLKSSSSPFSTTVEEFKRDGSMFGTDS